MLETRRQQRTDYATTAPMQTARPRVSRSSPEAALRCAAGAGLDGDPHGRATLGRAVWCGATNQPLRRRTPPPPMGPIYPTRITHSFSRRTIVLGVGHGMVDTDDRVVGLDELKTVVPGKVISA